MLTFGGIAPGVFGLYLLTEAGLSLSPGPAVLFVAGRGMAQGVAGAWPAALGIVLANSIYFLLSAAGIGAALAAAPQLFAVLRWLGAAYLLWLAWGAVSARAGALSLDASLGSRPAGATMRAALLLQLSNPKSLLFFTAVLPQFVSMQMPILPQMLWLALGSVLPEFFILLGYAWLASLTRHFFARQGMVRWLERACAVLLSACAALVLAAP